MNETWLRKKLTENYKLSHQSAADVIELVSLQDKYETAPVATKDSLQVIADMYSVSFDFILYRKRLMLVGVESALMSTYLYVDLDYSQKCIKSHKRKYKEDFYLRPGANNVLTYETREIDD